MAIKISPSNIFDINHSPIPTNAFANVRLDESNYNLMVGDVADPILLTFHELQTSVVGTDVEVSAVRALDKNSVDLEVDGNAVRATLTFDITKKTHFTRTAVNRIDSHSIRREITYWDRVFGERKRVTFEMPFKVISATDKQVIVQYETPIFLDPNLPPVEGIDWEDIRFFDTYILTDLVSIEGQYFEAIDKTTAVYDDSITAAQNILKLPSNELVQGDNTYGYKADAVNAVNYSDKFVAEVFDRYKNGKETATLLCSVGKYYDLDGNLVVDAENEDSSIAPLLKKYDIVVPYVMTSRGEAPLSTDASGNPKQFQIIGVNISYNGIPRQEIVIQEYAT